MMASTRHTRLIARHEPSRPRSHEPVRLEHESRFDLHSSPPPDVPESAPNGDRAPRRNTRNRHPCRRDAVRARTLSTSRTPALLAAACGVNRKLRQDASPLNQQTTNARRHPMELRRIGGLARPSDLAIFWPFVSAWTVRGGNRDGPAGPPPSFMMGGGEHAARSSSRTVARSSMASS